MRSSRILRDTATSKYFSTPSSSRAQPRLRNARVATTRSIRGYALDSSSAKKEVENESGKENESEESELSDVPTDLDSGSEEWAEEGIGGKRKRSVKEVAGRVSRARRTRVKVEVEVEDEGADIIKTEEQESEVTRPKKSRRAPAKKPISTNGTIKIEPPAHWEEVYELTKQMRATTIAPVDTMGCATLADRNDTPRNQRFQTLIALMLSSQTKDTVTSVAIKGMQETMPGVSLLFSH